MSVTVSMNNDMPTVKSELCEAIFFSVQVSSALHFAAMEYSRLSN